MMGDNLLLQIKDMLFQVEQDGAQLVILNLKDLHAVFKLRDSFCGFREIN